MLNNWHIMTSLSEMVKNLVLEYILTLNTFKHHIMVIIFSKLSRFVLFYWYGSLGCIIQLPKGND